MYFQLINAVNRLPKCKNPVSIKQTICPTCGYEKKIEEINTQYEDLNINPFNDKKPLNS